MYTIVILAKICTRCVLSISFTITVMRITDQSPDLDLIGPTLTIHTVSDVPWHLVSNLHVPHQRLQRIESYFPMSSRHVATPCLTDGSHFE